MTSLKRSGKAGPEEVGNLSLANQVEAKKQPEACQRGREPKSGSCTGRAPTGEFGGANYGTSCTGEARRPSSVQISEKLLRIVPATVRRVAVRIRNPQRVRVRVSKTRKLLAKADPSAHCSHFRGP
jgi:hypothetical protein